MDEESACLVSQKPLKPEFDKFHIININNDEFTIGRGLENSAVITYLAISRKHCTIKKVDNETWTIEDSSSFGIQVNDNKLKKGSICNLKHNDIIQLDATGEFVYKFITTNDENDFDIPRKRIKRSDSNEDILKNVRMKFEESQTFELKNIEEKINNAKQMQTTSILLKQQLELRMGRKIAQLQEDFALQIENLRGEKTEVERQKLLLEEERDAQLERIKQEKEDKISELLDQIKKHNETENELLNENTLLKEKLTKEREEFLAELDRESTSKQELLNKLETRIKEQEEISLKQKQELEESLRKETEQLRQAKDKELQELQDLKKHRELELEQDILNMKKNLEEEIQRKEEERLKAEKEMQDKVEEMKKANQEDKNRMEQLLQERTEAEKKLSEAQKSAEQSLEELKKQVADRETQLAALAAERIQMQAEQSTEVINTLQEQLEKVKSQLESVESEKNTILENICLTNEGSSKEAALNEVGNLMESELQCSICAEIFVQPTMLNCAHTYCKYCITMWKKKKNECPICRARITSECKNIVLDSFMEKILQNLNDDMKQKREAMLKDREAEVSAMMRPPTTTSTTAPTRNSRRRNSRTRTTTTTSTATVVATVATSGPSTASPTPTPMNTRRATTMDLTRSPAPVVVVPDSPGPIRHQARTGQLQPRMGQPQPRTGQQVYRLQNPVRLPHGQMAMLSGVVGGAGSSLVYLVHTTAGMAAVSDVAPVDIGRRAAQIRRDMNPQVQATGVTTSARPGPITNTGFPSALASVGRTTSVNQGRITNTGFPVTQGPMVSVGQQLVRAPVSTVDLTAVSPYRTQALTSRMVSSVAPPAVGYMTQASTHVAVSPIPEVGAQITIPSNGIQSTVSPNQVITTQTLSEAIARVNPSNAVNQTTDAHTLTIDLTGLINAIND